MEDDSTVTDSLAEQAKTNASDITMTKSVASASTGKSNKRGKQNKKDAISDALEKTIAEIRGYCKKRCLGGVGTSLNSQTWNPNCLNELGQQFYVDPQDAFLAYCEKHGLLLDDPDKRRREAQVPVGLKVGLMRWLS